MAGPPRRHRRGVRWVGVAFAVVVVVAIGLYWVPPVHARVVGGETLLRADGVAVPAPEAGRVTVRTVRLGPGLDGDLYTTPGRHPAVVFAYGMTKRGTADPRVRRLARALALDGQVVFVPQLDLRHEIVGRADVARLVESVRAVRRLRSVRGRTGFLGFSYGGSLSLVAAADPRIAHTVAFVATFGAYYSLRDDVVAIATGTTTENGRVRPWHTNAGSRQGLARVAEHLLAPSHARLLAAALHGDISRSHLPSDAAGLDAVLTAHDPRTAQAALARLPGPLLGLLDDLSPSSHLRQVAAPVAVLQSTDDTAVPPAEAKLLACHLHVPDRVVHGFRHVTPGPGLLRDLPDLWTVSGWGAWVLQHG